MGHKTRFSWVIKGTSAYTASGLDRPAIWWVGGLWQFRLMAKSDQRWHQLDKTCKNREFWHLVWWVHVEFRIPGNSVPSGIYAESGNDAQNVCILNRIGSLLRCFVKSFCPPCIWYFTNICLTFLRQTSADKTAAVYRNEYFLNIAAESLRESFLGSTTPLNTARN